MLDVVIDVSHFQGDIDFKRVKDSGIAAVILKATQGASWIDPSFQRNLTGAITSGLLVGAYHFGNGDDAGLQAKNFLRVAGSVPLKVLDFEENRSGESMTPAQANDFIGHITSCKFPMLYADLNHIYQIKQFDLIVQDCPLWIAQYRQEDVPEVPESTWNNWTLWQYTRSGIVPGINGNVDRSYFNGSQDNLVQLFS